MTRRVQRFLSDYDSGLVSEAMRREFDRLTAVPFLEGELIKNVQFTPGTAVEVVHNLRRVPQGWMVVRQQGDIDISRNGAFLVQTESKGFVAADWVFNGSTYDYSSSWTLKPEPGNFLVMACTFAQSTDLDFTSITQAGANQWRSGWSGFNSSGSVKTIIWYLQPAENFGVASSFSINRSTLDDGALILAEFGGVSTTQDNSFYDQRANDNNGNLVDPDNSAMESGLITPSVSTTLALGAFGIANKSVSMRSTGSFEPIATANGSSGTASTAGKCYLMSRNLGQNIADSVQADARLGSDQKWAGVTINFPTEAAFISVGYPVETNRSTRLLTLKHASTTTCDIWVF